MAPSRSFRGKSHKPTRGAKTSDPRRLFLGRLSQILGLPEDEVEARLSEPPGRSVRINRLAQRPATEIVDDLQRLAQAHAVELTPISWCPDAYHLLGDKRVVSESELFQQGEIYLQVASSLVPALALAPEPGNRILDVCAAPGGKAAHLAALVGNDAELWANDAIKPRAQTLREVLDLLNVTCATVTEHPGQYLDKYLDPDQHFDRILLDAQCSGEGRIDLSHPQGLRFWSLARITKNARLQSKILTVAFDLLKPGGVLVYSTCTFAPEENEAPIDRLLRHRPDADVEEVPVDVAAAVPEAVAPGLASWDGQSFDPRLRRALRILPGSGLEGFFVCRVRKASRA